jgi:hypothetical protein
MKKLFTLTIICSLFNSYTAFAQWTQVGDDLDGWLIEHYAGKGVALNANGSRVAVGQRQAPPYSGKVQTFEWHDTAWVRIGNFYIQGGPDDYFGESVSFDSSGNRLAVGAPGSGHLGYVQVYNWNGSSYQPIGNPINGEANSNAFGWHVRLSANGNRLAACTPFNNANGNWSGHVRIFNWNGTDWIQAGTDLDGDSAEDHLGMSLAISADGNTVAAGATYRNGYTGYARVYSWNGNNWVQKGSDITGQAWFENVGSSVSLSADGNRVAVGGSGIDTAGGERVYDWNGTAWVQAGTDILGESPGDQFGWTSSISADGNRLAVGAYNNWGTDTAAGQVRVYDWNGSAWVQTGADIGGEAKFDESGRGLCLSAYGNRVAIGAPYNDGNGSNSGHVRVYEYTTTSDVEQDNMMFAPVGVFPNPFSSQITFKLTDNELTSVLLFNFLGQQVLQQTFTNSATINTEQLVDGIYFYELSNDKGTLKTGKVVKQ